MTPSTMMLNRAVLRFASRFRGTLFLIAASALAGCKDSPTEPKQKGPTPTFVRLVSDPGDYIGGGQSYEYTRADAVIITGTSGSRVGIAIIGDEQWQGTFQGPSGMTELTPGTYAGLQRYPFHDEAKGGLSWSGEGRGCNTLSGWFTVDSITYTAGLLTQVDLHFEQHCEGGIAALRGTVHWRADDAGAAPGPVTPIPSGLWKPASGAVPSTGDYVYLKSDAGDYIGGGQTYSYREATDAIGITTTGGRLSVSVGGWNGVFQTMNSLSRLEPGYYPNLRRWPFHNPQRGGLSWSGNGRGCNTLTGWFVIDRVTYDGPALTAVDLRFEQHCEGGTAALRGAIRWRQ